MHITETTEQKSFTTPLFVFVPIVLIVVILCAAIYFSEFLGTKYQQLKRRISAAFSKRGTPVSRINSLDSTSSEVKGYRPRDSVESSFEGIHGDIGSPMAQIVERGRLDQFSPSPLDASKWKPTRIATHTGAIGRPPTKIAQSQYRDLTVAHTSPYRASAAAQSKHSLPSVPAPSSVSGDGIQRGQMSSLSMRSLSTTPMDDKTLRIRKTRSTKTLQLSSADVYSTRLSGFATPTTAYKGEPQGSRSALYSVDETESPSSSHLPRRVYGSRRMPDILQRAEESTPLAAPTVPELSTSPPIQPAARRRPSVKKRVLSKVMGSLQNNPKPAPRLRNGQSEGSLFRRLSVHSNSTSQSRAISSDVASLSSQGRESYSSGKGISHSEPNSSIDSKIDLVQLPMASDHHSLSPQSMICPSRATLVESIASQQPPFLLSCALRTMAEVEALDASARRTVWAAVEIEGCVSMAAQVPSPLNASPGLDVVVIIDNSYASPKSIENICNVVCSLAATLASPDDRIAVFCASCCHSVQDPHLANGCLLHALQAVNPRNIQDDLGSLQNTSSNTQSVRLSETIASAVGVLLESGHTLDPPLRRANGHVIVLSPGLHDSVDSVPDLSPLTVHFVSTSVIPSDFDRLRPLIKGWCMQIFASGFGSQADQSSQREALKALIACARYNADPGRITDIYVEIIPSDDCVLTSTIGPCTYPALHAGQTMTLLLQASVQEVSNKKSQSRSLAKSTTTVDEAFADLEMLLGEMTTDLFTVKVHYKHSHFPKNTELIAVDTCRVRRPNALSAWRSLPCSKDAERAQSRMHQVHRRLVSVIASDESPSAALLALEGLPDRISGTFACPEFMDLVRGELEHRCQALGCPIPNPEDEVSSTLRAPSPDLGRFSFEHRGTLYLDLPYRLSPKRASTDSPATVIHTRLTEDPAEEEPDDRARNIWRHMRKSSKSHYRLAKSSTRSFEKLGSVDAQLMELRKRAVQNKRSVGADTLRSLAIGTHAGIDSGVDAPWYWETARVSEMDRALDVAYGRRAE
ncbi:hypothetical protein H2201_002205 [Coniosporium apollinis]|uniref:VWFA domain-containing protein n=1 Tax=Coniosporium apollinis TaxID=61459 RepID=A0ABQ9NZ74_9PEZI|nr:hypothetical protein H2201_002205 [Coniosporium apollinis]